MALYYLETSALVKLYVREPGTDRVLALAARANENQLAILALSQIEFRSAIRRREKNREIPGHIASQLLGAFSRHLESRFVTQMVTDFVLDIASTLVDRYALRAFDAVQLAGYAVWKNSSGSDMPIFVCADHDLLNAAKQEGMPIFDPCS
ncbi:MAG TPA: type II toxin-antitoxin system VapC family toxin [Candidatus Saccharimonadales bacterium]|nr:type II toxin-antitoxin system VapC family toxin [Candidatus Saccharimonadales bacterium]